MFCSSCGSEELQPNQFCRACGTDLRHVRFALERPDKITASAITARDEIGRAVAAKIREMKSARDLKKVAEEVLPEIEKFLESPEQQRLRRVRAGIVTSLIGFGVMLMFILVSLAEKEALFMIGAGIVVFLVGLGIVINGLMFTVSPKMIQDNSLEADKQNELDQSFNRTEIETTASLSANATFASVTEHTTHQLVEKQK